MASSPTVSVPPGCRSILPQGPAVLLQNQPFVQQGLSGIPHNMKSLLILLTASFALALPQAARPDLTAFSSMLSTAAADAGPQPPGFRIVANDLKEGKCGEAVFVWARASTEIGNMGISIGPLLASALSQSFNMSVQGVDYLALLSTNFLPDGANPLGISEMQRMLELAASQCPDVPIVAGGYSQGAAVTHAAIARVSPAAQSRIAGVVTYGDTRALQSGGQIQGIARENFKILCNPGDLVCLGTLILTPLHFTYFGRVGEGAEFLAARMRG